MFYNRRDEFTGVREEAATIRRSFSPTDGAVFREFCRRCRTKMGMEKEKKTKKGLFSVNVSNKNLRDKN